MTTTTNTVTDFCSGDAVTIDHTTTGLPAPIVSAELGLKLTKYARANVLTRTVTTTQTSAGQILNAGTLQTDGTYTAEVVFTLSGADTAQYCPAGVTTFGYVQVTGTSTGPYTSEVFEIIPTVGGKYG